MRKIEITEYGLIIDAATGVIISCGSKKATDCEKWKQTCGRPQKGPNMNRKK